MLFRSQADSLLLSYQGTPCLYICIYIIALLFIVHPYFQGAVLWGCSVGSTSKPDVCVLIVAQLCPTLCDPIDCNLPGSSVHGDSPGKNTGVGCHALLQGIFPTQGPNPGVLHYRWTVDCLGHQGSPSPV